jgi:hypothetical protein
MRYIKVMHEKILLKNNKITTAPFITGQGNGIREHFSGMGT